MSTNFISLENKINNYTEVYISVHHFKDNSVRSEDFNCLNSFLALHNFSYAFIVLKQVAFIIYLRDQNVLFVYDDGEEGGCKTLEDMIQQWRIYIQRFPARAPLQQDQILSFLHMFS